MRTSVGLLLWGALLVGATGVQSPSCRVSCAAWIGKVACCGPAKSHTVTSRQLRPPCVFSSRQESGDDAQASRRRMSVNACWKRHLCLFSCRTLKSLCCLGQWLEEQEASPRGLMAFWRGRGLRPERYMHLVRAAKDYAKLRRPAELEASLAELKQVRGERSTQ
jgi:hypothetical protein